MKEIGGIITGKEKDKEWVTMEVSKLYSSIGPLLLATVNLYLINIT